MPFDVSLAIRTKINKLLTRCAPASKVQVSIVGSAPRNIMPGADWGEAIVDAIEDAKLMVLVFSQHSNASQQIKREVERAVHKGIPIIPFRIQDVTMSKTLQYFLSTPHWLDALTPPLQVHLDRLMKSVKGILTSTETSYIVSRRTNLQKMLLSPHSRAFSPGGRVCR